MLLRKWFSIYKETSVELFHTPSFPDLFPRLVKAPGAKSEASADKALQDLERCTQEWRMRK